MKGHLTRRVNMIIDCHFHVDETMLTLEKMIEGMDKNGVNKTVLIAPMNETMFDKDTVYQDYLYDFFRFLILHTPQLGFIIYDNLVRDGYFNMYGNSFKTCLKYKSVLLIIRLLMLGN